MTIIFVLAPFSLLLAGAGLAAFYWCMRTGQYEDPEGAAARILDDTDDVKPPA
jgi:cbb3-type cytochrome oxidase maturation protein